MNTFIVCHFDKYMIQGIVCLGTQLTRPVGWRAMVSLSESTSAKPLNRFALVSLGWRTLSNCLHVSPLSICNSAVGWIPWLPTWGARWNGHQGKGQVSGNYLWQWQLLAMKSQLLKLLYEFSHTAVILKWGYFSIIRMVTFWLNGEETSSETESALEQGELCNETIYFKKILRWYECLQENIFLFFHPFFSCLGDCNVPVLAATRLEGVNMNNSSSRDGVKIRESGWDAWCLQSTIVDSE